MLGASLLLINILTSRLESEEWKTWALLLCSLVIVAPYEIWFIFPINDRVEQIGRELGEGNKKEEDFRSELHALLNQWQARNFVRMGLPLCVGVVGMLNLSK
jgi:hypothetical protein